MENGIMIDIFSRLPLKSIFRFRAVSNTLRNLLLSAPFAYEHMHRQLLDQNKNSTSTEMEFLVRTDIKPGMTNQLYFVKYDEKNEQLSYERVTEIDVYHPDDMRDHCIVGSCNGLICFLQIKFKDDTQRHNQCPVSIFNPITREYLNLPRYTIDFTKGYTSFERAVYGFGYNPLKKEYKVVMIYYNIDETLVGRCQVYTLGSESGWRNKGEIKCSVSYNYSFGIFANGGLHWIESNGNVVSFDLEDETFKLIPLPRSILLNELYLCLLKVLEGDLCLVDNQHSNHHGTTRMWSLDKSKDEWKGILKIDWTSDFLFDTFNIHVPFGRTKQGKVLFHQNFYNVILVNPKSTEPVKQLDMLLPFHEAHPHIRSFVSLKALGEVGVRS